MSDVRVPKGIVDISKPRRSINQHTLMPAALIVVRIDNLLDFDFTLQDMPHLSTGSISL